MALDADVQMPALLRALRQPHLPGEPEEVRGAAREGVRGHGRAAHDRRGPDGRTRRRGPRRRDADATSTVQPRAGRRGRALVGIVTRHDIMRSWGSECWPDRHARCRRGRPRGHPPQHPPPDARAAARRGALRRRQGERLRARRRARGAGRAAGRRDLAGRGDGDRGRGAARGGPRRAGPGLRPPDGRRARRAARGRRRGRRLVGGVPRRGARPAPRARQVQLRHGPPGRAARGARRWRRGRPAAPLRPHEPLRHRRRGRPSFFEQQLERFPALAAELKARHPGLICHTANSAATLRGPRSHFDMVRTGIAIYGLAPSNDDPFKDGLRPAMG